MKNQIHPNGYIYLIEIIESKSRQFGKLYVGKSNGNKKSYITGSRIIRNIVRKYGRESINKKVLVKGSYTDSELNELEIFYIKKYDTYNNGLNFTLGGDGKSGCIDETLYTFYHISGVCECDVTMYYMRNKYNLGNINELISHKRNSQYGWYIDYKKIKLLSFEHPKYGIENNITLAEFKRKYSLHTIISQVILGKRKSHKGWEYVGEFIPTKQWFKPIRN